MNEQQLYARQICLTELGEVGQLKLKNSSVLVIGAGGLGSPVLQYLCAAGIGKITICDHDNVDISNLHRQTLFSIEDIGTNKAIAAKKELIRKNPFIKITALEMPFGPNIQITDYDLVIDCTDNFRTKFLAHDKCYKENINYIQASIHKFEGQIQVFSFNKNKDQKPCLRCLYPEIPRANCVQTCEEAGVIGALPGFFGSLQSFEAIKLLIDQPTLQNGESLLINLLEFNANKIKWKKNSTCKLCSQEDSIPEDDKLEYFYQFENAPTDESFKKSILVSYVKELPNFNNHVLHIKNAHQIDDILKLPQDTYITVVCTKGIRSFDLMSHLHTLGYINTFSLKNGILHYNSRHDS